MQKKLLCIALIAVLSPIVYAGTVIAGITRMTHALAQSNTVIKGSLVADHSKYEGDLTITSDKAVLSATTVKGVLTIKSEKVTPVLELRCESNVMGKIIFIGKPGIIKKTKDSKIAKPVTNGSIENFTSTEKCNPSRDRQGASPK